MSSLNYCRFCAEVKQQDDLTALKPHDRTNITEKLSLFGALVDFSDHKLPETMCIKCSKLIDVSYDFFLLVKRSQAVLSEICLDTEDSQTDMSNSLNFKEESDHKDYMQDEFQSSQDSIQIKEPQLLCEPSDAVGSWDEYPWGCGLCLVSGSLVKLRAHCVARHGTCLVTTCVDCGYPSDGFHAFVEHVRMHREQLRKYCEYCNIKLEDPTHTHEHTHTCTLCGQCFTNESSLTTHLHTYLSDYKHQQLVKPTTETLDSKTLDLANGHTPNWTEYPSVCKFCELKMVDEGVLRDHCVEVHRRCFGRKCVDCDNDGEVICFNEFVDHVRRHRPFLKNVCPFCNGADKSHDVTQHTNNYMCTLCGHTFLRNSDLRAHHTTTNPSTLKPPRNRQKLTPANKDLTCDTCGRVMKTPDSLRTHLKTHLNRKRNYTCEKCGRTYYTKGCLNAHTKTHENNKTETCQVCQKTFLTIPRLKRHVKTHNLKMPYQCDQCERFFSSKDRLRDHIKIHSNNKPFKCQYCSKTFRHKTAVRTHENQHTGARPYSCNVCCMEFANWSNCNKHMKRRHGTTLAKHAMTQHGKLALNPSTGRPDQLSMGTQVQKWTEMMLMGRGKKMAAERDSDAQRPR